MTNICACFTANNMCEADVLFGHKNYCIHVVFSIQVKDDAIVRIK